MFKSNNFVSFDLARWTLALTYDDLSPRAIELAKLFWLDSLGCAVGGSTTDDARILLRHYRDMAGQYSKGPCTALVSGFRTNPVDAAFLNAHLIRAMDFNDIYWKADPAHPSDLIAGPLSLCEFKELSGRELILATVIVYELQCRFAEIATPGIREYGWHHATLSGFASGLAAARILKLPENQAVHAVGICASRTGTLGAVTAGKLSMMKNTVDPWACRMGVESALLAQRGFTGPSNIIDGKEGLFHTFTHNVVNDAPCKFDIDGLTRDLPTLPNDFYRIEAVGMKAVPVEALMHSPLSAVMQIQRNHAPCIKEIASIKVEVIARAADILGDPAKYRPATRETADHSLPYAIAIGLVDGTIGPAQFVDSKIHDKSLRPLMDTVRVVPNSQFDAEFPATQPARVTMTLRNGTSYTAQVDFPKGDPRNPMTSSEIETKVRSLAEPVLGPNGTNTLISTVHNLETANSVTPMISATLL